MVINRKIIIAISAAITVGIASAMIFSGYDNVTKNDANMKNPSGMVIQGIWKFELYDENGVLKDTREVHNILTKYGLDLMMARTFSATSGLGMQTSYAPTNLVLGDCGDDEECTPPTIDDTGLEGYIRKVTRQATPVVIEGFNNTRVVIQQYVIGSSNNDETYREAGLQAYGFDEIFNRVIIDPPLVKASSDTLVITVTMQLGNS